MIRVPRALARVRSAASIALALLLLGAATGAHQADAKPKARSRTWTLSFQADTLGQAPSQAKVVSGAWEVAEDSTGARNDSTGAYPRLLRQTDGEEGEAHHWIRFLKPVVGDCEVSARFRVRGGELDPSVGIAFHLDKKGRNGYLVRVSGAESELIAHYLIYGKRRDMKYEKIDAPEAGTWHTLAVRREGNTLTVLYDGTERMKLRDERHHEGTVGLWTEDDTIADFADVTITTR
ncbi:MAG TPA: hypothetical protein VFM17_04885 [Candidatus Eisenbacteria bacterium]|nr:hypothetical protein [Candidatus Eisenbacteria bacterium]